MTTLEATSQTPALNARPAVRLRVPRVFEGARWSVLSASVDAVVLALVVAIALGVTANAPAAAPLVALFAPLALAALAMRGAYRADDASRGPWQLVAAACTAAVGVLALGALVLPAGDGPAQAVVVAAIAAIPALGLAHTGLATLRRRARAAGHAGHGVLIVGAGRVGAEVERRLLDDPAQGLAPLGFLDPDPVPVDTSDREGPVLGRPDDLEAVIEATGAREVIVAFSVMPDHEVYGLVRRCERMGLAVSVVPRLYEAASVHTVQRHLGGLPMLRLRPLDREGTAFVLKRWSDRVLAALMLVLGAPVFAVLGLAVLVDLGRPIFFRQRRVGHDGREFSLLKFRSMRESASGIEPRGSFGEDTAPGGVEGEDRRTRLGAFLRRTSLDELPQLWNVMRGEMSLVGPRPERPEHVERFSDSVRRYDDRHRVPAGLTGWAQVNGLRGQTSISDRVEYDNFYIENWSPWLDARVVARTLRAAVRGEEAATGRRDAAGNLRAAARTPQGLPVSRSAGSGSRSPVRSQ